MRIPTILHKTRKKMEHGEHPSLEQLITARAEMIRRNGVGIACNQLGYTGRWCIIGDKLYVNPEIIHLSGKVFQSLEGCLSVRGKFWVDRYEKVLIDHEVEPGKRIEKTFTNMEAIIAQHEIDHLNGLMITKGKRASY